MTMELTITCKDCGTEFHREGDFDTEEVVGEVREHLEAHQREAGPE